MSTVTESERQSIELRKKILKSTGGTNNVFEDLCESGKGYQETLNKLNRFKKKAKEHTKINSLKSEWISERRKLQDGAMQLEQDISSCLELLILHSPLEEEFLNLATDNDAIANGLAENSRGMRSQLKEIKEMLSEVSCAIKTVGVTSKLEQSTKNEAGIANSLPPVANVFADVLLEIRMQLLSRVNGLKTEQQVLSDSLAADKNRIFLNERNSRRAEQNDKLHQELQVQDGDSEDVLLFMEEWFHRLHVLDSCQETQQQVLLAERNSAILSLGLSLGEKIGGWCKDDHEVFAKVWKETRKSGLSRQAFSNLLQSQLPGKTPEELSLHEEWYRIVQLHQAKKIDAIAVYEKNRSELVAQAQIQLQSFRAAQLEARERETELREHEENRSELHVRLEWLRLQRDQRRHEQALADLQAEQKAMSLEAEKKAAELAQRQAIKGELEEYQRCKEEERAAQEADELAAFAAKEKEIRQQIEANRVHVQRREDMRQERIQLKQRELEKTAAREARRAEMLLRLAEQVPYFESVQNAHSKLDHITESVKNHEYVAHDPLGRGFEPMNGFADMKVIRDARFRLAAALRTAGVHATPAARNAMNVMNPRPHLAIHGLL